MAPKFDVKKSRLVGTLKVQAQPTLLPTGLPYWSANFTKPCRQHKAGSNICWSDAAKTDEIELLKTTKAACEAAGGYFAKAPLRPMPQGHVELDFLSKAQGVKLGVRPGAVLRLCTEGQQPGRIVPVKSPEHAQQLAVSFQQRIKDKVPAVARQAAIEVAGPSAPLGSMFDDVMDAGATVSKGLLHGLFQRGR